MIKNIVCSTRIIFTRKNKRYISPTLQHKQKGFVDEICVYINHYWVSSCVSAWYELPVCWDNVNLIKNTSEKLLLVIKLLRNESMEMVSSASTYNEYYFFTAIDKIFGFNSFNLHFSTMNWFFKSIT